MTPAARVQAAIDILEGLEQSAQPADRFLRDFFRARRYAGSKDRAAIAERVFQILRHRGVLGWRMQDESPRALVLASVIEEGGDPDVLFTGQTYAPAALSEDERRRMKASPGEPPLSAEGGFPPFLEHEMIRAFGDNVLRETVALQQRAPLDLRANSLKTTREDLVTLLRGQGIDAIATPHSPIGVRVVGGGTGLDRSDAFTRGLFEVQDEASQIAALLCGARPGLRVLDLAAGAGGKSLALAAAMDNSGAILACDVRQPALQETAIRAKRAGAGIVATHLISEATPPSGLFDMVLIDAPCSGSGTWRRQAELRWRLTPRRLDQLNATQDALLDQAARHVKPGGRLIYATCSLLPRENEDRVAAFRARQAAFKPLRADTAWRESAGTAPPPGLGETFRASPLTTGTDGFFAAILTRE